MKSDDAARQTDSWPGDRRVLLLALRLVDGVPARDALRMAGFSKLEAEQLLQDPDVGRLVQSLTGENLDAYLAATVAQLKKQGGAGGPI